MYLFIFEDNSIKKSEVVHDDDLNAADDHMVDIIDISGDQPKIYGHRLWHDLPNNDDR